MWELYGMSAPAELGGIEYHIGDLITTSAATTSNWGDNGLFFRHQWVEDDAIAMPAWKSYYPAYRTPAEMLQQSAHDKVVGVAKACPFAYLW